MCLKIIRKLFGNSSNEMGNSYQLTANATGAGNSGGPVFDQYGKVIGIFNGGMTDESGTRVTLAVPIKYGKELMKSSEAFK